MRYSLFTQAELEAMARRLKGDYRDHTGIFNNRVRPKLQEIQAWHTPKMRARIKKLLKYKYKHNDEPVVPNKEQSLEAFSKEVGY